MSTTTKHAVYWSLVSLGIGLVTPSLVIFCLMVFVGGIDPMTSIVDISRRQFAQGHNLFWLAVFGLIPFIAHSIVCFVAAQYVDSRGLACVAIGGLVGILAYMVPGHASVWYPLYGPGRMSSTAVIAFVFIPFLSIGPMCIGQFTGWLVSQLPAFQPTANNA